jgi:hypothetical protein
MIEANLLNGGIPLLQQINVLKQLCLLLAFLDRV